MNIIGFTHTKEELENVQNTCQQKIKYYANKANKYATLEIAYLIIITIIMVSTFYAGTKLISGFASEAVVILSLFVLMALCCGVALLVALALKKLTPKSLLFAYDQYTYYESEYKNLCEIHRMYELYTDLQRTDGWACVNETEDRIITADRKNEICGLPVQKEYKITNERKKHLLCDGKISFAYYDNELDEILKAFDD